MKENIRDLSERLLEFVVNTFKFLNTIQNNKEFDVFRYQLSKAVFCNVQ